MAAYDNLQTFVGKKMIHLMNINITMYRNRKHMKIICGMNSQKMLKRFLKYLQTEKVIITSANTGNKTATTKITHR